MKSSCRVVDEKHFDNLIARAILRETPALLFSLGVRKRVILRRLIVALTSTHYASLDKPESLLRRLDRALYVNTRPTLGTVEVWLNCRRIDAQLRRRGKRLSLIALANLRRITGQRKLLNIEALAKEIKLPVIVLASLSHKKKPPRLSRGKRGRLDRTCYGYLPER